MNGASLYIVHIIANFSLPVWGKRTLKASAKQILPFAIFPLVATVVYAFAVYGAFFPFPAYPLNVASIWVLVLAIGGIFVALGVWSYRKKKNLDTAGKEVETFN